MTNPLKTTRPLGFYNQRQKYFVDKDGNPHLWEVLTFPNQCFNPDGYELVQDTQNKRSDNDKVLPGVVLENLDADGDLDKGAPSYKGRNRAKKRFFDAMMSDYDLDCMVTLTFSPDKVERTSYADIIKRLSVWLDNRVRRRGLKYLLVPEYHKDGVSIHFHGFMNSAAMKLVDSGHKQKGRKVYNVADFDFGFTTAVMLDDNREHAAFYCYKYITKETVRIGGRYVLQGGNIRKPLYVYDNVDYVEAEGEVHNTPEGLAYKLATRG